MGIVINSGTILRGANVKSLYAGDIYAPYTTLLLNGNGANNANNNVFVDSSTNNFAITRNGNTTQGTFSPFSQTGWSNYFDGSGDYLSVSSTPLPTTGDFTFECWVYIISYSTMVTIIGNQSLSNRYLLFVPSDGAAYIQVGPTFSAQAPANTILTNRWYHIATTRVGTTHSMFVNGQPISLTVGGTSPSSLDNSTFYIGGNYNSSYIMNGYISNFRVVNSILYTSSFTPSTVPLSNVANTSILTCQSNRFIDNSTNNFTITRNGDTSVVAFSPFSSYEDWNASKHGGSGYFDGSGDWIEAAGNTALTFGTGNFTIETWVYRTSGSGTTQDILGNISSSGDLDTAVNIYLHTNNCIIVSTVNNNLAVGSISILLNTWTHLLFSFDGTTYRLFVNGVADGSSTTVRNLSNSSNPWSIGRSLSRTQYYYGFISGTRLLKGTALYTSNFTPPIAPLTAITNTSLLLNFTNAGIYDATSKNNLETVGNAQISNTTAKFGSTSIALTGASDYLRNQQASALWDFGTGNWTIESWIYPTTLSASTAAMLYSGSASSFVIALYTNKVRIFENSVSTYKEYTLTLSTNTWQHIAVVRNTAISPTVYVNGTGYTTGSSYTGVYGLATDYPEIGYDITYPSEKFYGYLQDIRITKGIARYTANFTPPVVQLLGKA